MLIDDRQSGGFAADIIVKLKAALTRSFTALSTFPTSFPVFNDEFSFRCNGEQWEISFICAVDGVGTNPEQRYENLSCFQRLMMIIS